MKISILQWLSIASTVSAQISSTTITTVPAVGDVTANFTSGTYGLDGPQLSGINATSFDWWYFDAVSTDLTSSLVIVFYTALPGGFPFLLTDNLLVIGVQYGFPNGTYGSINIEATDAVITTDFDGSSGVYEGANASWTGASDDSIYSISIDSPENGVVGTFTLTRNAPSHYPCGPVEAGQNLEVGPNIGWANAVPDAIGVVDFTILGSELVLTGPGYHDKNWSPQPFTDNVASWYWGHAHVGTYSLVWFDFLAPNGTEYVSAYVVQAGVVLVSSCSLGAITVRPTGANDVYPPTMATGSPGGFLIDVTLDSGDSLVFNMTNEIVIADSAPVYTRWTGPITASLNGGAKITGGAALCETFTLTA